MTMFNTHMRVDFSPSSSIRPVDDENPINWLTAPSAHKVMNLSKMGGQRHEHFGQSGQVLNTM